MYVFRYGTFVLFAFLLRLGVLGRRTLKRPLSKVLVVSFGGIRNEVFLSRYTPSPIFRYIETHGFISENGFISGFYLNTLTSHYTLATGVSAARHGIFDDAMYDYSLEEKIDYRAGDIAPHSKRWWKLDVPPLWITAMKYGRKACVLDWPSWNVTVWGMLPNLTGLDSVYEKSATSKIHTILKWLDEESCDLTMAYIDDSLQKSWQEAESSQNSTKNSSAHRHEREQVDKVNSWIDEIIKEISRRYIHFDTDVFIMSCNPAYGLETEINGTDLASNSILFLDDLVDESFFSEVIPEVGPVVGLWLKNASDGHINAVFTNISLKLTGTPFKALKRSSITIEGIRKLKRIGHIILNASPRHVIVKSRKVFKQKYSDQTIYTGYPYWQTQGFFIAIGPHVAKRTIHTNGPIDGTNLYHVLCFLLGIEPEDEASGSMYRIRSILDTIQLVDTLARISGQSAVRSMREVVLMAAAIAVYVMR